MVAQIKVFVSIYTLSFGFIIVIILSIGAYVGMQLLVSHDPLLD